MGLIWQFGTIPFGHLDKDKAIQILNFRDRFGGCSFHCQNDMKIFGCLTSQHSLLILDVAAPSPSREIHVQDQVASRKAIITSQSVRPHDSIWANESFSSGL